MAIQPKLAVMLMGPKGHGPMEEKAEKAGKKGFPKQSAKEEKAEMKGKKGKGCK